MIATSRRAALILSNVAALSIAAACPPANAAASQSPTPPPTLREHAKPHHAPTPAGPRSGYVYKIVIGGEIGGKANMACSEQGIRLTGVATFPESSNTATLWEKTPSAWKQRSTLTTGPATTITVPWSSEAETAEAEANGGWEHNGRGLTGTATTRSVCAATTPNAAIGVMGEGLATWRLAAPVKSAAALLAQPPTSISLSELVSVFTILPNGTVPAFAPLTAVS